MESVHEQVRRLEEGFELYRKWKESGADGIGGLLDKIDGLRNDVMALRCQEHNGVKYDVGRLLNEIDGFKKENRDLRQQLLERDKERVLLNQRVASLENKVSEERNSAEKAAADYVDLRSRYDKAMGDQVKLSSTIDQLQFELKGTRGALKNHVDGEAAKDKEIERLKLVEADNERLRGRVCELSGDLAEKDRCLADAAKANSITEAVSLLPTWSDADLYRFDGSETQAVLSCVRSFMEDSNIDTSKELENLLESAQDCRDLKQKFNDMQSAFEDWTNEMPSTDPDDY